jgi:Pyruvate/2-oxoacid:ferredoxin oxidoreductase delta subunit
MNLRDQTTLHVILYEGKGTHALSASERFTAVSALLAKGYTVACTRDERAAFSPPSRQTALIGRFEGCHLPETLDTAAGGRVSLVNLASVDLGQLPERVDTLRTEAQAVQQGAWLPWFPVIDYDRCTNCMQCLSFCLFGVYGVDEQHRITVQTSENCKTNCPACSRVCPEAAIVFPKYKAGPINGDVVSDTDLAREKMKVDISSLLGGDIYSMLRDRSDRAKSRFSKERDSDKALQERMRCLSKLAQMADIPAEVLMALPSPEEIQRRAEEAKAKAQAALRSSGQPG